ncbi:hypothetical protein HK407_01g01940 [Ordospora pajunii]|uniref:uncharacterized protein n=1 Tax=Ordospora pajunii TaxID=3039483 RepID=UPI002952764B|nr:uncharacterized protein HK407_01g01940 [Ordospora pajunii]KAH9412299.1 hypothetical protein HK407_01g01940 [Ordospora pajunii]
MQGDAQPNQIDDSSTSVEPATSIKKSLSLHRCFTDPETCARMQRIMHTHNQFRECIRDGNCLYISYAVALADLVCAENQLFGTLVSVFDRINSRFTACGIEQLGFSGFHETFVEVLKDVMDGTVKVEDVPLYTWYDCVAYLRLVVSAELKSNSDVYQLYIPDMGVDQYCSTHVDPFFKHAGCIEICALSNSIPIAIKIVDVGKDGIDTYADHRESISILYAHSHFEPVYEHEH